MFTVLAELVVLETLVFQLLSSTEATEESSETS
jgi:hypothetical protein